MYIIDSGITFSDPIFHQDIYNPSCIIKLLNNEEDRLISYSVFWGIIQICKETTVQCPQAKCSWKEQVRVNVVDTENRDGVDPELGIVGGHAIEIKELPYIVAIYRDGKQICGGVILNNFSVGSRKKYIFSISLKILSAAHCYHEKNAHYVVRAGATRLRVFSLTTQTAVVSNITSHPNYITNSSE